MSKFEKDPFDFSSVDVLEAPRTPEAHAERLYGLARNMGAVAERAAIGFGGDTMGSAIDRAARAVDVARHIPGLGKYARIAESVVDIAGTAHGIAGQVNERGAGAVAGNYLRDVAKGALDGVGAELGVEIGADGKRIVRKGKLAKGVFGLMKPKKFAGTMAAAAATGARGAAINNIPGRSLHSEDLSTASAASSEAPFDWTFSENTGERNSFGYEIGKQTATHERDLYSTPDSKPTTIGPRDPFDFSDY